MTVAEFVAKWNRVELTERAASQQHFLDLCEVFDHPKPAEVDPAGEWFTFERGAAKHGGGKGWADVWKRGYFGWEYKGKHKDLNAAYDQLLKYREALENPPLLVACDMDRIVIHTNFTATANKTYEISLNELDTPRNIEIVRWLFHEPERLRPSATSEAITTEVAERLGEVAQGLRARDNDPMEVARFLDRIVFCLFAEDVGLLPRNLFSQIVEKSRDPEHFARLIGQLFDAMAVGGDFGLETIRHFNGNLFAESPVLLLTTAEIRHVQAAARLDWVAVDPSIFGTLFERSLDPAKRSQLGAQYTSREDIETLIEPVVMQPLRREWQETKRAVENLLLTGRKSNGKEKALTPKARHKAIQEATRQPRALLRQFHERLAEVRVLDPACGSGNFLYVTLQKLKDLEKEVLVYAGDNRLGSFIPLVGPWQFYGIEVNPYAFDLAQTTVWIGYLQWIQANGFGTPTEPILRRMDNFRLMDAILDLSDPEHPREPDWPEVEFIVGNPPFLGDKKMRRELGHEYVETLRELYKGRVPGAADLVTYWFERARKQIETGRCKRAGLIGTQAIRKGMSNKVLQRIKSSGDIFFAISDRNWILEGANVHVSLVGFDDGSEQARVLDGKPVKTILSKLTGGNDDVPDVIKARTLAENAGLCFHGIMKAGAFNITEQLARQMLHSPNPHGKPNSDVLRPRRTSRDILNRTESGWIIDFGCDTKEDEGAKYELPWEYLVKNVKPERIKNRRPRMAKLWWIHGECRPGLRKGLTKCSRFIATPETSKHRIFAWLDIVYLADHKNNAFPRDDNYFFGILHSRIHEIWARGTGGQLREKESGFTYTPIECFEKFPFPEPTPEQEAAIAGAAKELDELRQRWLNPPEWTREEVLEFPGSVDGPWARYVQDADARGVGTVRYPRLVPKDEAAASQLAKRTLTNLYNQRPTWLDLAHRKLDEAVFAAYGWHAAISDEEILASLLALNLEREPAKSRAKE
ncbi:MAG TPA: DNA methyltransferase [Pyrinomonadaceae bacterium]|jgi:type II restriction/modification system DNA methylase subunit YeeA